MSISLLLEMARDAAATVEPARTAVVSGDQRLSAGELSTLADGGAGVIVGVVVAEPGSAPDPDDLCRYVRQRLRGSRTPDRIVFHDQLPTSPTGRYCVACSSKNSMP